MSPKMPIIAARPLFSSMLILRSRSIADSPSHPSLNRPVKRYTSQHAKMSRRQVWLEKYRAWRGGGRKAARRRGMQC